MRFSLFFEIFYLLHIFGRLFFAILNTKQGRKTFPFASSAEKPPCFWELSI